MFIISLITLHATEEIYAKFHETLRYQYQQHPDPPGFGTGVDSMFTFPPAAPGPDGAGGPTRFFISAAMVMNACSTFVAFLAEVSKNGMPNWSAYSFKNQKDYFSKLT